MGEVFIDIFESQKDTHRRNFEKKRNGKMK